MIKNAPHNFFPICDYELTDKFLTISQPGKMVQDTLPTGNDYTFFRKINWANNAEYLEQCIEQAERQSQCLMFGTHRDDQIQYITSRFPNKVITLSVNYTKQYYDILINNVVEYHIHLLINKKIPASELDIKNLQELTTEQLFLYYKTSFIDSKIIPEESQTTADYTIDAGQLFEEQTFSNWLTNLGFGFTDQGLNFYRRWLVLNKP